MSEWKECTIADLGEVVGGATPSTKKPENYENGDISWITPKDLSTFRGRYILRGERNITEIGLNSCSTRLLPPNTVLFSSRAPIGYVAIAAKEMCTNQGFKSVIPNTDTDFMFLYYLLKYNRDNIENMGSGTTFKEVSGNTMKSIKVCVPVDIDEQRRIGAVLSAIDDKIELNTAINENLEQQAQALFKAWFVDFEPFGGVMPENWQTKLISQLDVLVTDYVANGSFKSLAQNVEYQSEETDNVLIRLTDYNNNFSSDMVYITDSAYEFLAKSKLFGDEIIISNVGVNVGTVFRCPRLNKRMSLAPNSIMLRSDLLEHYLYLYFTSQYGQQQLQSIVTGSAQPKFNKTNFRSLSVLLPNSDVLESFNAIYTPIYNLIATNFTENQRLATLRDTLLSKLMNGEIDVSAVKI